MERITEEPVQHHEVTAMKHMLGGSAGTAAAAPAGVDTVAAAEAEGANEQLLQERDWDRRESKQGRRDLPSELLSKHPSLQDAPPAPAQAAAAPGPPSTLQHDAPPPPGRLQEQTCPTCPTGTGGMAGSACPPLPDTPVLRQLQPDNPLLAGGLTDECSLCAAAPGALESERQQLLARARQLEAEQAAHAAAAAEASRLRSEAAARAAQLQARLREELPARRAKLVRQQEAAAAELADLESRHRSVARRVASLEGRLDLLVGQEADLLQQRLEAERLRQEIEATRQGITARTTELESMASSLAARRDEAEASVASAATELQRCESGLAALRQQLIDLEGRRDAATRGLQAAQRERQEASAALVALEGERQLELDRLQSIDVHHLPALLATKQQLTEAERGVRTAAQELQHQAEGVQAAEQEAAEQKERLLRERSVAAARMASLESREAQLSCQAATLAAKVAGAAGLEEGEQGRAAAAAAEATGLKAAAATLTEARTATATITTSNTSTTTGSPGLATPETAGLEAEAGTGRLDEPGLPAATTSDTSTGMEGLMGSTAEGGEAEVSRPTFGGPIGAALLPTTGGFMAPSAADTGAAEGAWQQQSAASATSFGTAGGAFTSRVGSDEEQPSRGAGIGSKLKELLVDRPLSLMSGGRDSRAEEETAAATATPADDLTGGEGREQQLPLPSTTAEPSSSSSSSRPAATLSDTAEQGGFSVAGIEAAAAEAAVTAVQQHEQRQLGHSQQQQHHEAGLVRDDEAEAAGRAEVDAAIADRQAARQHRKMDAQMHKMEQHAGRRADAEAAAELAGQRLAVAQEVLSANQEAAAQATAAGPGAGSIRDSRGEEAAMLPAAGTAATWTSGRRDMITEEEQAVAGGVPAVTPVLPVASEAGAAALPVQVVEVSSVAPAPVTPGTPDASSVGAGGDTPAGLTGSDLERPSGLHPGLPEATAAEAAPPLPWSEHEALPGPGVAGQADGGEVVGEPVAAESPSGGKKLGLFGTVKQALTRPREAAQEVADRRAELDAERQAAAAATAAGMPPESLALADATPASAAEGPSKAEVRQAERQVKQAERELQREERRAEREAERETRAEDRAGRAGERAMEREQQAVSAEGRRAESALAQAEAEARQSEVTETTGPTASAAGLTARPVGEPLLVLPKQQLEGGSTGHGMGWQSEQVAEGVMPGAMMSGSGDVAGGGSSTSAEAGNGQFISSEPEVTPAADQLPAAPDRTADLFVGSHPEPGRAAELPSSAGLPAATTDTPTTATAGGEAPLGSSSSGVAGGAASGRPLLVESPSSKAADMFVARQRPVAEAPAGQQAGGGEVGEAEEEEEEIGGAARTPGKKGRGLLGGLRKALMPTK